MAQAPLREHYSSDEDYFRELDIYNTQVQSDLDNISASSVVAGFDDDGYPVVGGLRVGYQERYLHTRYATDSTGAGFTNDYTTISGLTVFQGRRNSDTPVESTNPAEYTWVEISVITGWAPSYRIAGGRLLDWDFSTSVPANFTLDNAAGAIDLDNFAVGAVGPQGRSARVDIAYGISEESTSEVQQIVFNGTHSNVVTGVINEAYTLTLPSIANSGEVEGGTPSYTFDLDTSNSVFSGTIQESFENNIGATGMLQRIAQTANNTYPAITFTDVSDVAGEGMDINANFDGSPGVGWPWTWDLPFDAGGFSAQVRLRLYEDEGEVPDTIFDIFLPSGTYTTVEDVIDGYVSAAPNGFTFTKVDSETMRIQAEARPNEIFLGLESQQFGDPIVDVSTNAPFGATPELTDNNTGTMSTNDDTGQLSSGSLGRKSIDILTNQPLDLQHVFTFVQNSGTNIDFGITVTNGNQSDLQAFSEYTVRDYNNDQISMYSGSVGSTADSDLTTVISRAVQAVNTNNETPIDFRATSSGSTLILQAQSPGEIPGLWSVSVDHKTGNGNIAPQTATRSTVGSDGADIATFYYPSGKISDDSYAIAVPPQGADFIAERYVYFNEGAEPEVSTVSSDYSFRKFVGDKGDTGDDAVLINISSDTGTIFRNTADASKTFTAEVYVGGIEATETQYSSYRYRWVTDQNLTVCVDSGGNVLSQNGTIVTPVDGVCPIGTPADTTQNTTHYLRSITVGPEDVNQRLRLGVEVTNI